MGIPKWPPCPNIIAYMHMHTADTHTHTHRRAHGTHIHTRVLIHIKCLFFLSICQYVCMYICVFSCILCVCVCVYFKNTKNLFIHIALIPIGDIPRVHPNILKCLHYSPVAKGLVGIATRAMVRTERNHHVIVYPLASARWCVILRSHILFFLLLILLISRIRRTCLFI